jgi:hypothetical protein
MIILIYIDLYICIYLTANLCRCNLYQKIHFRVRCSSAVFTVGIRYVSRHVMVRWFKYAVTSP